MKLSIVFVGTVADRGFNASALAGVETARGSVDAELQVVDGIPFDQKTILAKLHEVAADCDGVVFIGGQGNVATPVVAESWPNKRFAVVQGEVTGINLASYDVLQEQSAFLAGCLAGLMTETGIVGHLSGHRVRPGLKGRAAYVAGVGYTAPDVNVLTGFCGTQDDNAVAERWAAAEIEAGADIMFTMLNEARGGAIAACRQGGVTQIGNARDWTQTDPDVFVASAMARIDIGVCRAIADMVDGVSPGGIVEIGLADADAVSLALRPDVPEHHREILDDVTTALLEGAIPIPRDYEGPEFSPKDTL